MLIDQKNLHLKIKIEGLDDENLVITEFSGEEGISSTFEFFVTFHTLNPDIDLESLVGSKVKVQIDFFSNTDESGNPLTDETQTRFFCGKIGRAKQDKIEAFPDSSYHAFYKIWFYPNFWFLKFSKNYKIFQNLNTLDIISQVLQDNQIDFDNQTQSSGQKLREYCVQYAESDFDFLSRIMEEEGIFYFFSHSDDGHKLVISDSNDSFESINLDKLPLIDSSPYNNLINVIYNLSLEEQVVHSKFRSSDYNYQTSQTSLRANAEGKGVGLSFYEYPGLFQNNDDGEKVANIWIDSLEWQKKTADGMGACAQLSSGKVFTLENHPRKDANKEYVIYKIRHIFSQDNKQNSKADLENETMIYSNYFQVFPKETKFRPMIKTLKQRIYSSQTAFVCGSSEVFSDELGRVKVQFHWDLEGSNDENSSCWVRVGQTWSGAGWGSLFTPRVGMEVIVNFINGDPDRPIITGCVYNSQFQPPYSSGENPNYSTIKTQTINGNGFNEIRFSDESSGEEIYIHAQKDFVKVVENSRTEDINEGDDTLTIHKSSKFINILGKETQFSTSIEAGDKNLTITKGNYNTELNNGDHSTTLAKGNYNIDLTKGDYNLTITKGNISICVNKGDITIDTNGSLSVNATKNIDISALGRISISAGKGISIDTPKNVEINAGKNFEVEAGKQISMKSGKTMSVEVAKELSIKSGKAMNIKSADVVAQEAAKGFNIKSSKEINITSTANMALKSSKDIDINATSNVKAKGGVGMNLEGGTSLKANGGTSAVYGSGASTQLKAGASCMVKGPIVKIGP